MTESPSIKHKLKEQKLVKLILGLDSTAKFSSSFHIKRLTSFTGSIEQRSDSDGMWTFQKILSEHLWRPSKSSLCKQAHAIRASKRLSKCLMEKNRFLTSAVNYNSQELTCCFNIKKLHKSFFLVISKNCSQLASCRGRFLGRGLQTSALKIRTSHFLSLLKKVGRISFLTLNHERIHSFERSECKKRIQSLSIRLVHSKKEPPVWNCPEQVSSQKVQKQKWKMPQ